MELYFVINMFRNIIATFFENGIWVVGFFYLFLKMFPNDRCIKVSKYIVGFVLAILFVYSVVVSI